MSDSHNNFKESHSHNYEETSKSKHSQKFAAQVIPKERIDLFKNTDFYIYEKRFYNILPPITSSPKSLILPTNNDNYCCFNTKSVLFGLKSNYDILSNINMNTDLEKDFLKFSINTVLNIEPENYEGTIYLFI